MITADNHHHRKDTQSKLTMGISRSCSKYAGCFLILLVAVILYVIFLLQTYSTTIDSAQVDISFDIFERRQRIQQEKHKKILKEFGETLTIITNARENGQSISGDSISKHANGEQSQANGNNRDTSDDNGRIAVKSQTENIHHTDIPLKGIAQLPKEVQRHETSREILHQLNIVSSGIHQETVTQKAREGTQIHHANSVLEDILSSGKVQVSYTENVDSGSGTYKAFWVRSNGSLLQRVISYNAAIHQFRKELIKARGDKPWQPLSGALESLWCNRDDFHKELEKYPHVKTVSLEWHTKESQIKAKTLWDSSVDVENLLLQKYYAWTGSENLCNWIHMAGFTKARWDAVYNRTCKILSNLTSSTPQHLQPLYLHGKPINKKHYWPDYGRSYPGFFYSITPPQVLYMHIMEDAVVTKLGDVISGNLKLVPYSCSQDVDASTPPNFQLSPIYDEVFIMGQYWGDNFFHMMIENLPRVSPYLDFLKANPQIFIHTQATDGYTARSIEILGLHQTRLIKGTIRAQRVFLSQATPCGFANLPSIQILAHHYRNYLQALSPPIQTPRRSLLLIRRSGSRRFTQHLRIRKSLEMVAMEFNLNFEMFIDNPSPPMISAMRMFHRAALVVGPHGAGLSNLVYCQPGTGVIEGVCNHPHVNMCYQWTAHLLGLRYHGIGSRGGCETWIDVDYQQVAAGARQLLSMVSTRKL